MPIIGNLFCNRKKTTVQFLALRLKNSDIYCPRFARVISACEIKDFFAPFASLQSQRRLGTDYALSARPQRSAVTSFAHLCPRFAHWAQSRHNSLCSGYFASYPYQEHMPPGQNSCSNSAMMFLWVISNVTGVIEILLARTAEISVPSSSCLDVNSPAIQ